MIVCAFVDWCGDEDKEYAEIEEFLREELGWDFTFKPRVRPLDMLQQPADVFVLDYGGVQMGYGDGGFKFYRDEVIKIVEERPNLLVLMWTSFTGFGYFETAKQERPDLAQAPNVIFCDGNTKFGSTSRYDEVWQKRAKAWVGGEPKKRSTRELVLESLPSSFSGISVNDVAKLFPYLKRETIRRHVCALHKAGQIREGCVGLFSRR